MRDRTPDLLPYEIVPKNPTNLLQAFDSKRQSVFKKKSGKRNVGAWKTSEVKPSR